MIRSLFGKYLFQFVCLKKQESLNWKSASWWSFENLCINFPKRKIRYELDKGNCNYAYSKRSM